MHSARTKIMLSAKVLEIKDPSLFTHFYYKIAFKPLLFFQACIFPHNFKGRARTPLGPNNAKYHGYTVYASSQGQRTHSDQTKYKSRQKFPNFRLIPDLASKHSRLIPDFVVAFPRNEQSPFHSHWNEMVHSIPAGMNNSHSIPTGME